MAPLFLRTRDIYFEPGQTEYDWNLFFPSTNIVDTDYGTISCAKTIVTFKNIDLRTLIGANEYDTASQFKMEIKQLSFIPYSGGNGTEGTFSNVFDIRSNPSRGLLAFRAQGLPWIHSYSVAEHSNRDIAYLCNLSNYGETQDPSSNDYLLNNNPDFSILGETNSRYGQIGGDFQMDSPCPLYFMKPSSQRVHLSFFITPEISAVEQLIPSTGFISFSRLHMCMDWIMRLEITAM
jgi:hypothetical protein